jgi:hypothetical protein
VGTQSVVDIEIAGTPEAFAPPDGPAMGIRVPLTGTPDELLLEELKGSPALMSFCDAIEPDGQALLLHVNDHGLGALTTMMTALGSLIATANRTRAEDAMTEDERAAAAAEEARGRVQEELERWWAEQHER